MRDSYVSEDTQIQVTNVYRRNKTKRDKMKRTFNFVLKGMMLSSVLVSSVISGFGGALTASASGRDDNTTPNSNPTPTSEVVKDDFQDEQARILNLKNANKVLEAAIKSGQLDSWVYDKVMKSLMSLDVKLDIDRKFDKSSELIDVIMHTESLLSPKHLEKGGVTKETDLSRNKAFETLKSVQNKLKEVAPSEVVVQVAPTKAVGTKINKTTVASTKPIASTAKEKTPGVFEPPSFFDLEADVDVKTVATTQLNGIVYNDFDTKQYWAKDMEWMVAAGLITGYVNQKHPTTGKWGNWLNPGGQLTEAQMLSILLRYELGTQTYAQMQKDIPNPKGDWSYNHYVKAEQLGIVTKGSSKNSKTYANQQVTRGQLAQALVSMYYGKPVTLEQAVKFMFDNKLTSGTDPKKGPTLENFAPNTKLSRAHISVFISKYQELELSTDVKDLDFSTPIEKEENTGVISNQADTSWSANGKDTNIYSLIPKAKKTDDVIGSKIKTKFGERAYGAKNQAEYDATMKVLEEEYASGELDLKEYTTSDTNKRLLNDYFILGKTGIKDKKDPSYRTQYNQTLLGVEDVLGVFKGKVKTLEDAENLDKVLKVLHRSTLHMNDDLDLRGIDPVSAYDLVVKGMSDCTSDSYYMNAVYDQMGIDSIVIESPGRRHAYIGLKLHGEWYIWDNGSNTTNKFVKLTSDFIQKHDRLDYAPNGGIDSLPSFMKSIYTPKN